MRWPASTQDVTFERLVPLPLGHPVAGLDVELRCIHRIEGILGSPASNADKAEALRSIATACSGLGVAWRVGHLYLADGQFELAGKWLVDELRQPYAQFFPALQDLAQMRDSLSNDHRESLRTLGTSTHAPMWLPSTELQMGFIAAFVCEADARYVGQALIAEHHQAMDQITFECVGAETTDSRYFALPNMTDAWR